ncbi:Diacetyl reductase [(S)-acetoin forming] [Termitomyces sp. J132]|nr:Diacetyl reductase [(S)-acetoin forming] [Termitomyces sp. J132]
MATKGVALVTGAGRGIGRAIALRLADDGFDVAVNDISATDLEALAEEIKSKQRKSSFYVADVSIEEEVPQKDPRLDDSAASQMVANAGIAVGKSFLETTEADWDKLLAVNVKGTFFCYKHAGAQMIAQGHGGRIIGASSIMGKQGKSATVCDLDTPPRPAIGTPIMAAYSATKFAIRSLTQSAASQRLEALALGPHGITVNAYAPGPIETPLLQHMDSEYAALTQGKTGDLLEIVNTES